MGRAVSGAAVGVPDADGVAARAVVMNGPTPTEVRTGVVPLRVVAAKKPGQWIVRAMSPFTGWETLRRCAEQHVGTIDPDIEWSHYEYGGWPGYVVYGEGDLPRLDWPTGVFLFRHSNGDVYQASCERLGPVR
jgi:hypothetical protein